MMTLLLRWKEWHVKTKIMFHQLVMVNKNLFLEVTGTLQNRMSSEFLGLERHIHISVEVQF